MNKIFPFDISLKSFQIIASVGLMILAAGCASGGRRDSSHETASEELKRAGVPNIAFVSEGQLFNLNYVSLPRATHLKLHQQRVHFDGEELAFLWTNGSRFEFFKPSTGANLGFLMDEKTGRIHAHEVGLIYIRTWTSRASADEFSIWAKRFEELGASTNRFGFVAQTKFIDGSRTELRKEDRKIYLLEVQGASVTWDGDVCSMSIVTMENGSSAVELKKEGGTFWLYGGGNFQINFDDSIKTVIVGSSKPPTGSTLTGYVPQVYVDLYPRLKQIALGAKTPQLR